MSNPSSLSTPNAGVDESGQIPSANGPSNPPAQHTDALTDGRRHRSVTTRQKIVDALTDLIRQGTLSPTAEQVAERAQVGLRTVFRHFEDMETLYREIDLGLEADLATVLQVRLTGMSWQERLHDSIRLRIALYERVAPFHLAAMIHRQESGFLDAKLQRSTKIQREHLKALLPADLWGDSLHFEALAMTLSIASWIQLRKEQGLSMDAAERVVIMTVQRLTEEKQKKPAKH
jgi:AcrR family transcriptional regulator